MRRSHVNGIGMDLAGLSRDASFSEKVKHYIDAISRDTKVVLSMTEKLGHLFTSGDVEEREMAVEFVTQVLEGLPERSLSSEYATPLLHFYTSDPSGAPSSVPLLVRGVHALVARQVGPCGAALERAWRYVLQEVQVAGLLHRERYLVYRTLAYFVLHHPDALPGNEFVEGYIQAVEGERDPRCLLQVFATVPVLCHSFILGELEEPLFDACACYFPVDFRPPPDADVSREDLAHALKRCLTACPAFGPRCVALAVEKLGTDLPSASLDALQLLEEGAAVFHPACFRDQLSSIWKELHSMVLIERKEALVPAALSTLTSLTRAVSSDPDQMRKLLEAVWKDVQRGEAPGATEVLEAFARGSGEACSALLAHGVPHLLELLAKEEGRRATVLECVARLLVVRAAAVGQPPEPNLCLLVDQLCVLLDGPDRALADGAATALAAALDVPGLLDGVQLRRLLDALLAARYAPWDVSEEQRELLGKAVALGSPAATEAFRVLRGDVAGEYHPDATPKVLRLVAACSTSSACLSSVLDSLSSRLADALSGEDDRTDLGPEHASRRYDLSGDGSEHSDLLARSILDAVERARGGGLDVPCDRLLRRVASVWLEAAARQSADRLSAVAALVETLTRNCDRSTVAELLSRVVDICSGENVGSVRLLLECLVCHAPAELVSFRLAPVLVRGDDVLLRATGALVNKVQHGISEVLRHVEDELRGPWTPAKVDLLLWVTKGLLLRGYPGLDPYLDRLVHLLEEGDPTGRRAALGYDLLLRPSELTVEGHCTVNPTHAQRLFVRTVARLVDGFASRDAAIRDNFLTALCCQLKYVPRAVVNSYIDQVLPVLVAALDGADDSTVAACILPCLSEHASLAASRLEAVVGQLLRLASPPRPLEVRKMALECLEKLAAVEDRALLQQRRRVLRGLAPGLADRKRLVRRAAAAASSAWAVVGQPRG